jgi:hypothetical protein
MKYSLTPYSQTISNTSVGDINLTTDEVISVINTTAANIPVPASGTTSGTLVLDCDLGARVHVDEVQYYFESSTSNSGIAPYIEFQVKNESFEIYISLNTYFTDNYFYATISGTDSPRYVRVIHTVVSGSEGNIGGFRVLNDDTYVDFGEDSGSTFTNVNMSLDNAIAQIDELEVFNSGPVKANAKLILEPQNDVSDTVFAISDSADGPWYGIYQSEDAITGEGLWDTGNMDDVRLLTDKLVLDGVNTVGSYTTRIIKLDEYQKLTFNVMDYRYPILVSEIEFFDDFSAADTYWNVTYTYTWTPDAGYIHSFSNEISYYRYYHALGDNNIIFFTTKSLGYEYTQDWQLSFDFLYHYHRSDIAGMIVYPLYPQLDFYFRVYTDDDPSGNAWIVVNGTSHSLSAATDWATNIDTWFSIRIQRNFTIINLKVWKKSDPEPEAWSWTGSIALDDLPQLGGIRITDQHLQRAAEGGGSCRLDNFILIKNYSASVSNKSIIATDDIDTLENIEVRSSNSEPMPRTTYVELTGSNAAGTKFTQHRWTADGSIAETSSDWGGWGQSGNYWEVWYDSYREDEYIVDKGFYTGYYGNTAITLRIRRKDGASYSTTLYSQDYDYKCYWSTYRLSPDSSGGFWIYFFLAKTNVSDGDYYLRYYNATMGLVYNRQATSTQGTFLYDMDSVYAGNGIMWYTDRDLSTVFKVDNSGAILASYLATEDIRGVMANLDGGCWFIQQKALIRLSSAGEYMETIELPTDGASYVFSDFADGFWIHDGWIVRHLASDGTEIFNAEIPNLYFITPAKDGVLAKHHDGNTSIRPKASFIDKDQKRVVRTWDYPVNEGAWKGSFDYNRYGVRSHLYDDLDLDHASHFPIAIDTQWNTFSEWKKVSLRDYTFTNDEYHQIRFTLRADNSANSPEIYGLYTQRAIEIPDIYPGNYGKFYLKSDVNSLTLQDTGDFTSNVRAYWYLDSE